jgi:hypothetical protein
MKLFDKKAQVEKHSSKETHIFKTFSMTKPVESSKSGRNVLEAKISLVAGTLCTPSVLHV